MKTTRTIQVNDADYGDGRVVIELEHSEYGWVVPPWEEMGLPELEGTFASREEAAAAIASVKDTLPDYGFAA